MIRVEFLANELGPAAGVDAEPGDALVDVSDACRAPVSFSCRSASCGTCLVEVLEGAALLAPPKADESEVLDLFDAPPSQRLACAARLVAQGEGLVRLRWAGSDE
ncbi:2Fe-2S iron-sulfur cluster-binding protein [Polyangium mundeleinium]|uniref:2Fe-2S iron-sulfur cluster-binding protein n=1 Tax=Polyangium mundeleinium TaxID=2995306 RepID=A0ABT5F2Y2_9BACT|nr:2Fe-2S iron-sulfur cluster-binding protein [Polyangium mundeleinium]MDC0748440.1 2Fe-2S iron-sulfur cluster-binding protein [Polyangium mundeleinium]